MIRYRRAAAALVLAAAAVSVFGLAAPAFAHVSVTPEQATQGGHARLTFRVPNESATASTTKVEIFLPVDAPVASVSGGTVPGWTVITDKRTLGAPLEVNGNQVTEVVSKITWTATGGAPVKPGESKGFPVSVGPLPAVNQMVFKVLQTYSNGEVARWIEEPPASGGAEPEHPAPVLKLRPAAARTASPSPSPTDEPSQPAPSATPPAGGPPAADPGGDAPTGLAVGIGVAAGLAGLAVAAVAIARSRRATPPAG
jgi:uncharacterized protein YcnI